ncbi:MAG: AbrB/MazE/SpoVT family DNA-binding domain-containing protein [Planctomycetes bacterium]|nr:AbrB/MazE/SpoVT family DNA-binding domain-containing protein [Planctomycetota bacterium]
MTTVMSKKGQIVLPAAVRESLHLEPGDDFEISVQDEDTIVLQKISRPPNKGLVDLLLACPFPFEIPDREVDDTASVKL